MPVGTPVNEESGRTGAMRDGGPGGTDNRERVGGSQNLIDVKKELVTDVHPGMLSMKGRAMPLGSPGTATAAAERQLQTPEARAASTARLMSDPRAEPTVWIRQPRDGSTRARVLATVTCWDVLKSG